MSVQIFFDHVLKMGALSPEELQLLETHFEYMEVDKGEVLERENEIAQHLYFLAEGYVRLYYSDEKGEEICSDLCAAPNFTASYVSLIHNSKSREALETISACKLFKIDRLVLRQLIDTNAAIRELSLRIFEYPIRQYENRANDLATLSAEVRYLKLLNTQREIVQNVPIQYIASYLGIKPESLSRIRRKINH
jgi:CRP/FNR family transcriptional regulator, anaerobic regulatory protein